MRGDFVLYKAQPGNFANWLISNFTNGPFVHVEIDLGDGTFVGEHGTGIVVHKADGRKDLVLVTPKSKDGQAGIDAGMRWIEGVIDEERKNPHAHEYGWLDIAADTFKLFGQKVILREKGEWDCSHFVALYLHIANADAPLGHLMQTPETISPNDLARAYGVL